MIGTNVQAWDADLDALAALATTTFGRSLLTLADQAAGRSAFGLGSAALLAAGVAGGAATLDPSTGKLLAGQVPDALLGAVRYQSGWNAATNTPALGAASAANKGFYYIVTTAGTTSLTGPAGPITEWQVGDWAVSDGTYWEKVDSSDQVISVAGLQGAITAVALKAVLSIGISDVSGLSTALGALISRAGDQMTGALNFAAPVTVTAAATTAIGAAASNLVEISGATTITAFDTVAAGAVRFVRFQGALTLTHNAASLILPGSASIAVAVGDTAVFRSLGSGNWRCIAYQRADGTALVAPAATSGLFPNGERLITASGTITAADSGKQLVITATAGAAITLTADTAANLGPNFYCGIKRADGVLANVSIAAAASQTVEARASIAVWQEEFFLRSNGSILRTQDRPRSVVLGRVALTGQTLSAYTIATGFADTELSTIDVEFSNVQLSGFDTLCARVTKNGTLQTGSTYNYEQFYASGSGANQNGGFATLLPLAQSVASQAYGRISFIGFQGTALGTQAMLVDSFSYGSTPSRLLGAGTEATNGAVQSFTLFASAGSTLSSFTLNLRGQR